MAENPVRIAAAAQNGIVEGTLLEAIVKRYVYTINVGELWVDLDQSSGEIILAIFDAATGYVYSYDATDSTSVDDGLTVRVDGSGHRYMIEDAASISISTVLDEQNAPPGSPTVGDTYIVGAAPSGAWAAHATDIAIYTKRGWVFAVPEPGMTVFDQASGTNQQFDENGDWVDFVVELADGSVRPVSLQFPMGISVEAQQNAPPAITIGPHYLVGTSGSGLWSGHSNKVAYSRDGTTWEFLTPYEGGEVYDKSSNVKFRYDGSAWVSVNKGIVDRQVFTTVGAGTWTKPSGLASSAMVLIEMWGGGGGGGGASDTSTNGMGGGGGAYVFAWVLASLLGSTESVSVGAAGNGGNGSNNGTAGGNSTFGSWLTAPGGARGTSGNGGGNEGTGGAITAQLGVAGGAAGNPGASVVQSGAGGGRGNASGGTSKLGGNGGAGSASSNGATATAGSAPGGGGGGGGAIVGVSTATIGAAGARGEIRVTVFN